MPDRHAALHGVDRDLDGIGKGGAALDEVIAQEPKLPALREDRGLVLERSIPEVEDETIRQPVTVQRLNEIAVRDDGAVGRSKDQKSPKKAFGMSHGHELRPQDARSNVGRDKEQRDAEVPFQQNLSNRSSKARTAPIDPETIFMNRRRTDQRAEHPLGRRIRTDARAAVRKLSSALESRERLPVPLQDVLAVALLGHELENDLGVRDFSGEVFAQVVPDLDPVRGGVQYLAPRTGHLLDAGLAIRIRSPRLRGGSHLGPRKPRETRSVRDVVSGLERLAAVVGRRPQQDESHSPIRQAAPDFVLYEMRVGESDAFFELLAILVSFCLRLRIARLPESCDEFGPLDGAREPREVRSLPRREKMADGTVRPVFARVFSGSGVGTRKRPVRFGERRRLSCARVPLERLASALEGHDHRLRIQGGIEMRVGLVSEKHLERGARLALPPQRGEARAPVEKKPREKRLPLRLEFRPGALGLEGLEG